VLYFYGPACAACAQQRSALTSLPSERLNLVAVDAAGQPDLAAWAGVLTVPSTAIVDPERRLRAVNHGFRPADDLAAQLAAFA
jgi:thioredoxin-like negative regulator of GroEL